MDTERTNKQCKSYPCHDGLEDCMFCYCPFYACQDLKTGGKFLTIYQGTEKKKIWDCSECNMVHKKEFVDKIFEEIRQNFKNYGPDN
jgi:Zn-finger protein